jgi:two-component system, cell cycle response regulator
VRVLIAEDDPVSRRMLEAFVSKWGYDPVSCGGGAQARELLAAPDAPRLVILDWVLPEVDGVELCREVRARSHEPYVYIILLTSRTTREDFLEGMGAGADDYLVKPCDAHELRVRLRAGRRILELQEELIAAREALREQATHDPLTQIWNRAVILEMLAQELERDRRAENPLSVVMLDLDHFKDINDHHGHLTGDAVLRETARRMRAGLRSYDMVGRYGGEEFMIVLPGCDAASARKLAERVRHALADRPVDTAEGPVSVTCSLGVSCTTGLSHMDAQALIRAADGALYEAKAAGRDRVEIARSVVASLVAA